MSHPQALKRIEQYQDALAKGRLRSTTFAPSTKHRRHDIPMPHPVSVHHQPVVEVVNRDVVDAILALPRPATPTEHARPPLVLNLASYQAFGGGVERGAVAQEEELFRKTDYGCHRGRELYPLQKEEFVVTPSVAVLKTGAYRDLPPDQVRIVDMLAVSAVRLSEPADGRAPTFSAADLQTASAKIETVFRYAAAHGYRRLVLGALGCGVYRNPPEVVARLFYQMMHKYAKYFDHIVYAVHARGDNPNFDIFHRVLLGRPPMVATAADSPATS
jgi:uncharacterized protein (TIGR02452 family)